jgi:hypothetical protein
VIRHALADLVFVERDAAGFDVIDQQVENGQGAVAIEELREPFRQPVPGDQVGMPSLGVHEVADVQFLHVRHDAADEHFHDLVVSGEKSPVHAFPILAGNGEVLPDHVKDLPPMHQVFVLCIDQLVVEGMQQRGALLVDRRHEVFEPMLLRHFRGNVFDDKTEVLRGQAQVVTGFESKLNPLVNLARDLFPFPKTAGRADEVGDMAILLHFNLFSAQIAPAINCIKRSTAPLQAH